MAQTSSEMATMIEPSWHATNTEEASVHENANIEAIVLTTVIADFMHPLPHPLSPS